MNRDATIVQVAMLLIIIAVLGVAILKQQQKGTQADISSLNGTITPVQEATLGEEDEENDLAPDIVDAIPQPTAPQELLTSDNANIVKEYFRFIAEKNYIGACSLLAGGKCNATRPAVVANFSREFEKMSNGYEYINIKDYGLIAPSGKGIVCVKYSYRYKNDPQPGLVSEIMSFYVDDVGGELKITDRVCEKKYKENRGLRDCPIQAAAEFCEGLVK